MIPYARQEIDDADVAAVAAALRAPFLTQGPAVARFEAALAEAVGARHAVAFSSGTAALHAAYAAAGAGPGFGVLTSPVTFAATANAARYLGAPVQFADVDAASGLLDPAAAARAAAHDVAILAPVHLAGQVADLPALAALAARRGWTVIEDAAHALGATWRDAEGREHRVGDCALSAMTCFSFHAVKHVTTGEGGAVTTNDADTARRLRRFRTHGITRDPAELQAADGPWYYEQHELGFNYRLSDLQCALGLSQLARLGGFVARRREIAARYAARFAAAPHVRPLAIPAGSHGSWHLYVVLLPPARRRATYDALHAAGIQANVHYLPVYRHPYYRRTGFAATSLPGAEAYYAGALSLPMWPGLDDATVDRVADLVIEAARPAGAAIAA